MPCAISSASFHKSPPCSLEPFEKTSILLPDTLTLQSPKLFVIAGWKAGRLTLWLEYLVKTSASERSSWYVITRLLHCTSSRACSFRTQQITLRRLQVCLARVLLKQPALLALDEATSALDQTTEVLFQRVLEEKFQETTILCIAHRLETLRWCRTRIEMGTGKLLSISDFNPQSAASHH
jgi:ABC-type branched-subunit amino acid transport system ATPase component